FPTGDRSVRRSIVGRGVAPRGGAAVPERSARAPEWRKHVKTKRYAVSGAVAAGVLVLASCGTDVNVPPGGGNPALDSVHVACGEQSVSAEGSSAQKNAMDLVARDYSLKCPGEQLN